MCFCPSFMRPTYSLREVRASGDLEEWKRSRGSRRRLAVCGFGRGEGSWGVGRLGGVEAQQGTPGGKQWWGGVGWGGVG